MNARHSGFLRQSSDRMGVASGGCIYGIATMDVVGTGAAAAFMAALIVMDEMTFTSL
jgi:hypothetical protein